MAYVTLETEISTANITLETNVLSLWRISDPQKFKKRKSTITFFLGSLNPQNKVFLFLFLFLNKNPQQPNCNEQKFKQQKGNTHG